ncbi:site-specific DNA-methyltransferase [Prosthecochloris sp.]|uniref:DNA-methyltransferase n=1 Tax=Prosthecochloris sp. TaxID=290513 RepID=UPI0025DDAF83|nr:site-specific DNA-methyltransferase [Prosthecochloris sp.]
MSTINLHNVDCLEGLRDLPDESVHCCVTSPPYWGLRDYKIKPQVWDDPGDCEHEWHSERVQARTGTGGNWQQAANGVALRTGKDQTRFKGNCAEANKCETVEIDTGFCRKCGAWLGSLGLEPTPELYVKHMVDVFREVRRVLREDGTLWLNLGDSYGNTIGKARPRKNPKSIKPKDLIGVPWLVAFALRADGWYLRQDIIWHKPNPMPESVRDRCTKAHEYVFLLSKSRQYYYDAAAIREPASYGDNGSSFDVGKTAAAKNEGFRKKVPSNWDTEPGTHRSYHRDGRANKKSGNKERKPGSARGCPEGTGSNVCGSVPWQGDTRNKRSVWTVSTKPFKDAHFATFPEELIEPCILAGCPEGETVLDPFAGAGTTGVVAARGYRNFIGFEINPEYCEMARKRIEAITRQGRLFEPENLSHEQTCNS